MSIKDNWSNVVGGIKIDRADLFGNGGSIYK